ncbi:MAG: hypothetical protein EOO87_00140 [Pedobacter sp.]|nr:MAG: hypothetical protein EOO87_00140 [Pedobacter sp.]
MNREQFLETQTNGFSFQPGDFGYETLGEFEPIGLLTSPYPHHAGFQFFMVYANARNERLLIRYDVHADAKVHERERIRYSYRGAQAY